MMYPPCLFTIIAASLPFPYVGVCIFACLTINTVCKWLTWELGWNLQQSTECTFFLKKIAGPTVDLYLEMNGFSLQTLFAQFPILSSLYHLPYTSYHWDSFMRPISSLENSQMIENWSLLLWYYFWLWPNLRAGRVEIALIFSQFQRVAGIKLCITTAQSKGWLTRKKNQVNSKCFMFVKWTLWPFVLMCSWAKVC